jgi:hypothetical protein
MASKGKVVDGVTDATAWSDLSWLNNPNGDSEPKKVATRGKVERGKPGNKNRSRP